MSCDYKQCYNTAHLNSDDKNYCSFECLEKDHQQKIGIDPITLGVLGVAGGALLAGTYTIPGTIAALSLRRRKLRGDIEELEEEYNELYAENSELRDAKELDRRKEITIFYDKKTNIDALKKIRENVEAEINILKEENKIL